MVENIIQQGMAVTLALFGLGAVGALFFQKFPSVSNAWAHGFAALGSLAGAALSLTILLTERSFSFSAQTTLPLLELSLRIDYLAAFFMLVVSGIAFCASLYGIGAMAHSYGKYHIGSFGFFYNIFIASMLLVFSAQNAIYFLFLWEIMSLASYALVTYEHREEGTLQAGYIYFAMTHAATACIVFAFLLLYRATGSFDFDVIRESASLLSQPLQGAVLLLALVGFGTKAGIIPLHVWLPKAHPAAPAHVSALMSGVMIKTGIFMLLRFFLEIVPFSSLGLGIVILLIGAVSSLLGVLYALCEHDLKRLLAYHSIENIGIILLGFGAALIFGALRLDALMIMALVACLYHTANHAVFKALLFLGAGSVAHATHTRNIEEYGGLIKALPWTAFCFLVGSLAISGMPPFNGFVSEWMTFQALFAGVASKNIVLAIVFLTGVSALAFTGGLAAACFVKAFGVTFLAKARSEHARRAKECGVSMRVGMAFLAFLCLVLGVGAGSVVPLLSRVAEQVFGVQSDPAILSSTSATIIVQNGFATLSMPLLAATIFGLLLAVVVVVYLFTSRRKVTRGLTWDCGSPLTSRMEITATGFSRSLLTIFQAFVRPTKKIESTYADEKQYIVTSRTVEVGVFDVYEAFFYGPLNRCAEHVSRIAKKIQSGNVNAYILYIAVALASMLLWVSLS